MKKRSEQWLRAFEARMGLCSKGERIWFWCGFALLLCYLEVVFFLQNVFLGSTSPIFMAISALAAVPACFLGVSLCRRLSITPANHGPTARGSRIVILLGFLLTLGVMLTAQAAFFPGSFNNDNIVQLSQVYSGQYSNWHPALHTWLFFTLPLKLVPQHWFIITLQQVWFSMAVSYLLYVLYTSRAPHWLLCLTWFYTVCNPNSIDMMLYPVKDSAMTIFCLVFFSYLVRIYLSQGQWLKKPGNLVLFSLFGFLSLGMRHNAVLLIGPIFLFLLIFWKPIRRYAAASAGLALALALLWQNAVLPLANVEAPGQRTVEMVGLPMTVLCDIYAAEPDALTPEAREFMESLAEESHWAQYEQANFNSIKWISPELMPTVDAEGAGNILRYALGSALNTPKTAMKSFAKLTHLVWGFENTNGFSMGEEIGFNSFGIEARYQPNLKFFFTSWRQVCNETILKYAFTLMGPGILLLLFLAVSQLAGNLRAVFLVLAPMAYDFGTMLLLSGPDYRFFHMHYAIVIPLIYIILMNKRLDHAK